jgi:hypothetical protein
MGNSALDSRLINTSWSTFLPVWIFLVGLVVAAVYWIPTPGVNVDDLEWSTPLMALGADPARFLLQGSWLSNGSGYREVEESGLGCTSLPPGHPVFLAIAMCFTRSLFWLRILQVVVHALSGVILFYAFRGFSLRWASLAGILVSGSPWGAALSSSYMSETTGAFLVCVVTFLAVTCLRPQREHSIRDKSIASLSGSLGSDHLQRLNDSGNCLPLVAFLLGAALVLACLTAPGVSISMVMLFFICVYRLWPRRASVTGLILGASIVMGVWQWHCVNAVGQPALGLLHPLQVKMPGLAWVRTWARSTSEHMMGLGTFEWPNDSPDYAAVPEYAYRDDLEKNAVLRVSEEWRHSDGNVSTPDEAFARREKLLMSIFRRESQENRFRFYVELPVLRGVSSWIDLRPANYLNLEDPQYLGRLNPKAFLNDVVTLGLKRSLLRTFRGFLSLYGLTVHILGLAIAFISCWLVFRARSPAGCLLLLSVAGFTYIHGLQSPESRRNVPVLPIIMSAPAFAACFAVGRVRRPVLAPET